MSKWLYVLHSFPAPLLQAEAWDVSGHHGGTSDLLQAADGLQVAVLLHLGLLELIPNTL